MWKCSPIVLCVVFASSAIAGDLNPPPGPVAPSMKTLDDIEPRTAINDENTPGDADYRFVITEPGSYYLESDVISDDGRGGIEVTVNDVTIDLMGFRIFDATGASTNNGIEAGTRDRVSIRNGKVRGFEFGIRVRANSVLRRITVQEASTVGIFTSTAPRIEGCYVSDCGGTGISAGLSSVIRDCVVLGNFNHGLATGANSVVTGCAASLNTLSDSPVFSGIFVGSGSVVTDCSATSNRGSGFGTSGDGVRFEGCVSVGSSSYGFDVDNRVTLVNCVVEGATLDGIRTGEGGNIIGCTIEGAGLAGIRANAESVVRDNTLSENADFGIVVAFDCHVIGNLCDSSEVGIDTTSGDNRIEGNHVTDCTTGYLLNGTGNFLVRNTAAGNTTDYDISAGNDVGTIQTSPVGAGPWDNFEF